MRKAYLVMAFSIFSLLAAAQENKDARQLVQEGIALHDKGNYEAAIEKYEDALKIDKDFFDAYYEKSYSLYSLGKTKECASLSKDIIKKFPEHPSLNAVYIQYGSALDDLGKPKDALEIYEEGIKKFPGEYLLHFNKALTLQKTGKNDEALEEYQFSLALKPLHSSSNLYTGLLLHKTNKIPALLAYCTFLAIEPNTKRSKETFTLVQELMGGGVKKDGNNVTIFLDPSILGDKKKGKGENDFKTAELIFTMSAALDKSKEVDSIAKTPADKFSLKLQLLINSIADGIKEGKGFYWTHYAPFFADMKEKDQVGTLARLLYLSAGDEENTQWVSDNEAKVEAFYDWLKAYKWK